MMDSTQLGISIHAPREGGDDITLSNTLKAQEFQSTPPARGATRKSSIVFSCIGFQSTPPARGATVLGGGVALEPGFQSTPPARGATTVHDIVDGIYHNFNPRPPRGGRPCRHRHNLCCKRISIHAPREGGDFAMITKFRRQLEFQSTPPARGATPGTALSNHTPTDFNPRPPRGGRLPMEGVLL